MPEIYQELRMISEVCRFCLLCGKCLGAFSIWCIFLRNFRKFWIL